MMSNGKHSLGLSFGRTADTLSNRALCKIMFRGRGKGGTVSSVNAYAVCLSQQIANCVNLCTYG
jgi:hypothetical protein